MQVFLQIIFFELTNKHVSSKVFNTFVIFKNGLPQRNGFLINLICSAKMK